MQSSAVQNTIACFPVFTVREVSDSQLKGSLNITTYQTAYQTENWIADNCIGFLMKDGVWLYGRWHLKDDEWIFNIKESLGEKISLKAAMQLYALDGYWGDRIKLVLDKSIQWKLQTYNQKDDHDHCSICCKTIAEGMKYRLGDKTPLCVNCYENYVKIGSLEFITPTKTNPDTA
jgi:hypothetical protein